MKFLKVNNLTPLVFGVMIALTVSSCKKPKEYKPIGDAGQTLVKILGGGPTTTPAISPKPIDFVPTPSKILAVEVRRDVPNETELNTTMTVTVKDDTAAVTSKGYLHLPTAWYTLQMDGTKTGGQGGVFTFTFKPGEFSKSIFVIIPDATLLDPSLLYGLGFTLLTADAGKLTTQRSVIVEIGAKNPYDGVYTVVSGWVQRYTSPTTPETGAGTPGNLNGDLTGNPEVVLATTGAYRVAIPPSSPAVFGRLQWAFGSNSAVAGIDGVQIVVDPSTNLTTATSSGYGANSNATFANWPGHVNKYDVAAKTFTLAWRWNPTANVREYEIVLKYKEPR